jgi:hypothetical protein
LDIEEFLADFNSAVAAAAHADENFRAAAFLDVAAERLADAQEVNDLQTAHFEGTGSSRRKLRLDGAVVDDADGSLILLVGEYRPGNEVTRLTTTDAKQLFAAAQAFVEDAVSGRLAQSLEESSEAYRTAMMISRLLPTVSRLRFYLVTNALMSDRIKDFPPSKFGSIPVSYHIWDIARLLQAHLSVNGREDIVLDLTKWVAGGLPALRGGSVDEGFQTYLAVLPAAALASIYLQYGSRLLEGNVRSFLSTRVSVNKGIRATLSQEPSHFLAFNNGLTTTASSIETADSDSTTRILSVTDLQIVNGGQTTASLASFLRDVSGASLEGVFVQMKLVVVDPTDATDLAPDIAKFANSQNRISEADFFSNSPYHRRLEELSRRLLAPGRAGSGLDTKWFYERARGQYLNEKSKGGAVERRKFEAQHPRSQVLIKTDVAKYLMSWDQHPQDVSLGAQKNFLKFASVANSLWESRPDEVNELYFKTLVAKAILFSSVHRRISEQPWYQSGGYLANLTTYTVAKLASVVAESAKGQTLDWSRIWASQSVSEPVLQALEGISLKMNDVLMSSRRGVQNVSEWAKKEECWSQAKAVSIEVQPALRAELIGADASMQDKAEARTVQRIDSGIESQMRILSVAQSVWIEVRDSPETKTMLSPQDRAVLRLVTGEINGAIPESFQVQRLLNILERAREFGVIPRT